jgi:hypothetical protein
MKKGKQREDRSVIITGKMSKITTFACKEMNV